MLQNPDNLTIVEGVVGLCAAFRHEIVAAGVETTDHALMLMEMGCDLMQGYGIAQPMTGGGHPGMAATIPARSALAGARLQEPVAPTISSGC